MGSPISEMIYKSTGIDLIYIIGGLGVLTILCMILTITALCKLKKVRKKYELFTRGKDAESLEDTIMLYLDKMDEFDKLLTMARDDIVNLRKNQKMCFQKLGIVKYDALFDLSGQLSCAIAVLDQMEDGFILNTVYSRDASYAYVKEIRGGISEIELSREEEQALEQAKNKA